MAIELVPLPLPASADPSKFADFGREVKGVNPGALSPEEFEQVKDALYKVFPPFLISMTKVFNIDSTTLSYSET